MPSITCPLCLVEFSIDKNELEDEVICPECGALLDIVIRGGKVEKVKEVEEEFESEEEEEWEEQEEEKW